MPITFKNTATAAIAAFSIAAGAAAPAHAFGSNERKFFQGVAAAVIIGTILNQNKRSRPAAPAAPEPIYRVSPKPKYDPPEAAHRHQDGRYSGRNEARRDEQGNRGNVYYSTQPPYNAPLKQGRIIGADNSGFYSGRASGTDSDLSQTATARAFNSYSYEERRAIQRRLASFGYYGGAIDGAFGPRTHQALYAFAGTANKQSALESTTGAFAIIDALMG